MNARESRLTQVEQALQAFQWHRGLDTDAVDVVSALAGLRDASLEVVRAVVVSERTTLYRETCISGSNLGIGKFHRSPRLTAKPLQKPLPGGGPSRGVERAQPKRADPGGVFGLFVVPRFFLLRPFLRVYIVLPQSLALMQECFLSRC